jgi:tetratricopeptide (TPR) repeat protein
MYNIFLSMELREQNMKHKFPPIIRVIAAILVIAFIAQDVVWAYPDIVDCNLAVTGLQNKETLSHMKVLSVIDRIERRSALKDDVADLTVRDVYKLSHSISNALSEVKVTTIESGDIVVEVRFILEHDGFMIRYFDPALTDEQRIPAGYEDITKRIAKQKSYDLSRYKPSLTYRQVLKRTGDAPFAPVPPEEVKNPQAPNAITPGSVANGKAIRTDRLYEIDPSMLVVLLIAIPVLSFLLIIMYRKEIWIVTRRFWNFISGEPLAGEKINTSEEAMDRSMASWAKAFIKCNSNIAKEKAIAKFTKELRRRQAVLDSEKSWHELRLRWFRWVDSLGLYKHLSIATFENKRDDIDNAITACENGSAYLGSKLADDIRESYAKNIIARACVELGNECEKAGDLGSAIIAIKKALEFDLNNANYHHSLGSLYFQLSDIANARIEMELAVHLAPNNDDIHNTLGVVLSTLGEKTRALEEFQQAIALDPHVPVYYDNMGNTYFDMGELTEALKSYHKAVELDPDSTISWGHIMVTWYQLGLQGNKEALLRLKELAESKNKVIFFRAIAFYTMLFFETTDVRWPVGERVTVYDVTTLKIMDLRVDESGQGIMFKCSAGEFRGERVEDEGAVYSQTELITPVAPIAVETPVVKDAVPAFIFQRGGSLVRAILKISIPALAGVCLGLYCLANYSIIIGSLIVVASIFMIIAVDNIMRWIYIRRVIKDSNVRYDFAKEQGNMIMLDDHLPREKRIRNAGYEYRTQNDIDEIFMIWAYFQIRQKGSMDNIQFTKLLHERLKFESEEFGRLVGASPEVEKRYAEYIIDKMVSDPEKRYPGIIKEEGEQGSGKYTLSYHDSQAPPARDVSEAKPQLAPKYIFGSIILATLIIATPLCIKMGFMSGVYTALIISVAVFLPGWGAHELGHKIAKWLGKTNIQVLRAGPMASIALFTISLTAMILIGTGVLPNIYFKEIPLSLIFYSSLVVYAFHATADEWALFHGFGFAGKMAEFRNLDFRSDGPFRAQEFYSYYEKWCVRSGFRAQADAYIHAKLKWIKALEGPWLNLDHILRFGDNRKAKVCAERLIAEHERFIRDSGDAAQLINDRSVLRAIDAVRRVAKESVVEPLILPSTREAFAKATFGLWKNPSDLWVGIFASVYEAFNVLNPRWFLKEHKSKSEWAMKWRAGGIAFIWAAMCAKLFQDIATIDYAQLAASDGSAIAAFIITKILIIIFYGVLAHAAYNIFAYFFERPMLIIESNDTSFSMIDSNVIIGEPIDRLEEVPGLYDAAQLVYELHPELLVRTKGLLYDTRHNKPRFRWARGIAFPMEPRKTQGGYEILVDETYRDNARLKQELAVNGYGIALTFHQAMFLDATLREILLLNDGAYHGVRPLELESARILAARAWMEDQGLYSNKDEFLGSDETTGLAALLDTTCPNGHPGRFTHAYKMLLGPSRTVDAEGRVSRFPILTILGNTISSVQRLKPELGRYCDNTNVLRLFIAINPIDGRQLAKSICDEVARKYPDYMAGKKGALWPYRILTHPEEAALFKALKEYPDDKDVKNAILHCYVRAIYRKVKEAIGSGDYIYAKMEEDDVVQIMMKIFTDCLRSFHPEDGNWFITYLTAALDRTGESRIGDESKKLQRGAGRARTFLEDEDGRPETSWIEQAREGDAVENILKRANIDEVKKLIARLPPKGRLIIKLLYGIRFDGAHDKARRMEDIARLFNVTRQDIDMELLKYMRILKGPRDRANTVPNIDDGDIYLATKLRMHPDSGLFCVYVNKGMAWLENNREAIKAQIASMESSKEATENEDIWSLFKKELNRSNQIQGRSTARAPKILPISPYMRKKCSDFKALVRRYINRQYANDAEKASLIDMIVAMGTIRAPVKKINLKAKAKSGGKRKTVERREVVLSTLVPSGKMWRAYNMNFPDIVYVTATKIDGRLNIQVNGRLASKNIAPLYNSYWDEKEGLSIDVVTEHARFFLDTNGKAAVPSRRLCRKVNEGIAHGTYIEAFTRDGVDAKMSVASGYAYVDSEKKIPRTLWLEAFKDSKGKGEKIYLTADGPAIGKAYFEGGRFICEPGPLSRGRNPGGEVGPDSSLTLRERLKGLSSKRGSDFIIKRNMMKAREGKKRRYFIAPFGVVKRENDDGSVYWRSNMVTIAVSDRAPCSECYVKFIPYDRSFEAYPSESCLFARKIVRKFYDLETVSVFSAGEELKRRFGEFLSGGSPKAIAVDADDRGKICFAKGLKANLGYSKRHNPYFVIFENAGKKEDGVISIYQVNKDFRKGGRPTRIVQRYIVCGTSKKPLLKRAPGFEPHDLSGIERMLVQEKAYNLGYTGKPRAITKEEELAYAAAGDTGGWKRPDLSGMKAISKPPEEIEDVSVSQALDYLRSVYESYCREKGIEYDQNSIVIGDITKEDMAAAGIKCSKSKERFYKTAVVFTDINDGNKVKVKFDPLFAGRIMAYNIKCSGKFITPGENIEPNSTRRQPVMKLALAESLVFRTMIHEIGKHAHGSTRIMGSDENFENEEIAEKVSSGYAPYNLGARLFDRIFYEEGFTDKENFQKALALYLDKNKKFDYWKEHRAEIENAANAWYDHWMSVNREESVTARPPRLYCKIITGRVYFDKQPIAGKAKFDTGSAMTTAGKEAAARVAELKMEIVGEGKDKDDIGFEILKAPKGVEGKVHLIMVPKDARAAKLLHSIGFAPQKLYEKVLGELTAARLWVMLDKGEEIPQRIEDISRITLVVKDRSRLSYLLGKSEADKVLNDEETYAENNRLAEEHDMRRKGLVRHVDRWMTPKEAEEARMTEAGFVKFEDQWMKPEEAAIITAARNAAELSRRAAEAKRREHDLEVERLNTKRIKHTGKGDVKALLLLKQSINRAVLSTAEVIEQQRLIDEAVSSVEKARNADQAERRQMEDALRSVDPALKREVIGLIKLYAVIRDRIARFTTRGKHPNTDTAISKEDLRVMRDFMDKISGLPELVKARIIEVVRSNGNNILAGESDAGKIFQVLKISLDAGYPKAEYEVIINGLMVAFFDTFAENGDIKDKDNIVIRDRLSMDVAKAINGVLDARRTGDRQRELGQLSRLMLLLAEPECEALRAEVANTYGKLIEDPKIFTRSWFKIVSGHPAKGANTVDVVFNVVGRAVQAWGGIMPRGENALTLFEERVYKDHAFRSLEGMIPGAGEAGLPETKPSGLEEIEQVPGATIKLTTLASGARALDFRLERSEDWENYELFKRAYTLYAREAVLKAGFKGIKPTRLGVGEEGSLQEKAFLAPMRVLFDMGFVSYYSDDEIGIMMEENRINKVEVVEPLFPDKTPYALRITVYRDFKITAGKFKTFYLFIRKDGDAGRGWEADNFLGKDELAELARPENRARVIGLVFDGRTVQVGLDHHIPHLESARKVAEACGRDEAERSLFLNKIKGNLEEPPKVSKLESGLWLNIATRLRKSLKEHDDIVGYLGTTVEGDPRPIPPHIFMAKKFGYGPAFTAEELSKIIKDEYIESVQIVPVRDRYPTFIKIIFKKGCELNARYLEGQPDLSKRTLYIWLWNEKRNRAICDPDKYKELVRDGALVKTGDSTLLAERLLSGTAEAGVAYVLEDSEKLWSAITDGWPQENREKHRRRFETIFPVQLKDNIVPPGQASEEESHVRKFAGGEAVKLIKAACAVSRSEFSAQFMMFLTENERKELECGSSPGASPALVVRGTYKTFMPSINDLNVMQNGLPVLVLRNKGTDAAGVQGVVYIMNPAVSGELFAKRVELLTGIKNEIAASTDAFGAKMRDKYPVGLKGAEAGAAIAEFRSLYTDGPVAELMKWYVDCKKSESGIAQFIDGELPAIFGAGEEAVFDAGKISKAVNALQAKIEEILVFKLMYYTYFVLSESGSIFKDHEGNIINGDNMALYENEQARRNNIGKIEKTYFRYMTGAQKARFDKAVGIIERSSDPRIWVPLMKAIIMLRDESEEFAIDDSQFEAIVPRIERLSARLRHFEQALGNNSDRQVWKLASICIIDDLAASRANDKEAIGIIRNAIIATLDGQRLGGLKESLAAGAAMSEETLMAKAESLGADRAQKYNMRPRSLIHIVKHKIGIYRRRISSLDRDKAIDMADEIVRLAGRIDGPGQIYIEEVLALKKKRLGELQEELKADIVRYLEKIEERIKAETDPAKIDVRVSNLTELINEVESDEIAPGRKKRDCITRLLFIAEARKLELRSGKQDQPTSSKGAYVGTLKGRRLPSLSDLDLGEEDKIAVISPDQITMILELIDGRASNGEIDRALDKIFGRSHDAVDADLMKLKETFFYMIELASGNDKFRDILLTALRSAPIGPDKGQVSSSNLNIRSIAIAISDSLPIDSARYFDNKENQAIIVFNSDFFNLDTCLDREDAESKRLNLEMGNVGLTMDDLKKAVFHVRAERLMHELRHDNTIGKYFAEIKEETEIIATLDVPLLAVTNKIGMQEKIKYLRLYPEVKAAMHNSGDIFELMPAWLAQDMRERKKSIRKLVSGNLRMPKAGGELKAKAFNSPDATPDARHRIDELHSSGWALLQEAAKLQPDTKRRVIPINVDTLPLVNAQNEETVKAMLEMVAYQQLALNRKCGPNKVSFEFVQVGEKGLIEQVLKHRIVELYNDLEIVRSHKLYANHAEEGSERSFLITDKDHKPASLRPIYLDGRMELNDGADLYMWDAVLDIAVTQTILLGRPEQSEYYGKLSAVYSNILGRLVTDSEIEVLLKGDVGAVKEAALGLIIPSAGKFNLESLKKLYEHMRSVRFAA